MKNTILAIVVFAVNALSLSSAFAAGDPAPLPKFYEVASKKIYRSAAPSEEGLAQLADMKFRTVLDVRDENPIKTKKEGKLVRGLGMNFISIPLSGLFKPSHGKINEILKIITDPQAQPVLVHCAAGEDRTGLIMGLYRVIYEGVSPKDAYDEMLKYGFHKTLIGLRHYFENRTGYDTDDSIQGIHFFTPNEGGAFLE